MRTGRAIGTVLLMTLAGGVSGLLMQGRAGSPTLPAPSPAVSARPAVGHPGPTFRPTPTARPTPSADPTPMATSTLTPPDGWTVWPNVDMAGMAARDDPDNDGLSEPREEKLGTDPWRADSDGGGEKDGSELAAGRDPLEKTDDRPLITCSTTRPQPTFEAAPPGALPVPAPDLEALLPDPIGDRRVRKWSVQGLPEIYGFFNFFWRGIVACTGAAPEDLSHAVATHRALQGLYVFAIRVDGLTGREVERLLFDDVAARSEIIELPVDLGDRSYEILWRPGGSVSAWYASGDVLYHFATMSVTDSGLWLTGILQVELIEEVVRSLPSSGGPGPAGRGR